jgi:uncharacterized protein with von Willebrand factor type A (vWA) domain
VPATYPFADLPANVAAFCAVLRRDHGFRVGHDELRDALRALQLMPIDDERAVRNALRPILSHTLQDAAVFDRAFDAFFHPAGRGPRTGAADSPQAAGADRAGHDSRRVAGIDQVQLAADAGESAATAFSLAAIDDTDSGGVRAAALRSSYSPAHSGGSPLDLGPVDDAWRAAAASFITRIETALSRRWAPALRGRRFDFRRTLRRSLATGGEVVLPRWQARPHVRPRFVSIIDGSRSMADHRAPAVSMTVALAGVTSPVAAFVFSTELRDVTHNVKRAAAGERLRLPDLRHAWGGGTGIGSSLREFVHRYGAQLLGRNVIVIVASDGLDLGPPDLLRGAMARIQRRSAAIVWLNPLVESAGYEPTAAGMRAARPFVSTFAWAGDAEGLRRLAREVRIRAR